MSYKPNNEFNIAIVGAGTLKLTALEAFLPAIALRKKWGFDNFVIYERGADVGGTWRDNTYPGCASDVPIHLYSLSSDLKPDWKNSHGTQPEILEYMREVTDKRGLRKYCSFHTSVDKAEWDATANVWRLEISDVRTGEKHQTRATALISAIGVLVVPSFPKLQGIESFKGEVFHSARWNHDVDLHGKRVGVVGNGSSAAQFVPKISADPTVTVTNFARTPMWYMPSPHVPYSGLTKWAFAYIPFVQRIHRFLITVESEAVFFAFKYKGKNLLSKYFTRASINYIRSKVPAKYHDVMIPKDPYGCKRVVRDQGYLPALNRPNVELTFERISHIEPDGIVTEAGDKVPVDVIVYGTGFVTDNYPMNLRGPRGTLKEYNDAHGGPQAYLGTTVPGFPNFFMMQGTLLTRLLIIAFASSLMTLLGQAPHILDLLAPVRDGVLTSVSPKDSATDKYNDMLQDRLEDTVWSQCASWYRVGSHGRIFSTFPGPLCELWWWLRKPHWEDFEFEGPGAKEWRRRHASSFLAQFGTVALVGALGSLAFASKGSSDGLSDFVDHAGHFVKDVQSWLVQLLAV
ncbi:FAD/NAD-P-binding domain-containing protein [Lactarius akahatsu]|uniref:FAD/NAD-P-binding domain-containing protein n=1 Tax=Lactarius akahatsu TaxID=416441 RepID=A0AAD4L864_9AGAM|nr:FAD/NAD-P-binding domain-containing protein [Lactarius akahatsu]